MDNDSPRDGLPHSYFIKEWEKTLEAKPNSILGRAKEVVFWVGQGPVMCIVDEGMDSAGRKMRGPVFIEGLWSLSPHPAR